MDEPLAPMSDSSSEDGFLATLCSLSYTVDVCSWTESLCTPNRSNSYAICASQCRTTCSDSSRPCARQHSVSPVCLLVHTYEMW